MAPHNNSGRSKPKKSVRMMDAVVVQDEDGQVIKNSSDKVFVIYKSIKKIIHVINQNLFNSYIFRLSQQA